MHELTVAAALGFLVALAPQGDTGSMTEKKMGPMEAGKPEAKADYPQTTISNDLLKLTVNLPDAEKGFYRATRFAWSGLIARAEFGGRTVYGPFRAKNDPLGHDNNVTGPAEEFDLETSPPGFDEAKSGEAFLKIGVGALVKPEDPKYQFWNLYKFAQPPVWKVTVAKDSVEFQQEAAARGWGYSYTKRIALQPGATAFTITYTLKNTGTKAIDTLFYCHNFTIIDDEPIGPNYRIVFPFPLAEAQGARGKMELKGGEIVISEVVVGSLWAILALEPGKGNQVIIENRRTKTSVTIRGDWAPTMWRFYAEATAACPEPFLRVQLAPGEEKTWSSVYTLVAAEESKKH